MEFWAAAFGRGPRKDLKKATPFQGSQRKEETDYRY